MGHLDDLVDKLHLNAVKELLVEHYPKLVGVATAAGSFGLLSSLVTNTPAWALGSSSLGLLMYFFTDYHRLLNSYRNTYDFEFASLPLDEHPYVPKFHGLRRIPDLILEYPDLFGLASCAYWANNFYHDTAAPLFYYLLRYGAIIEPFRQELNKQFASALVLNALFLPCVYYSGRLGCNLLSLFFHSENREGIADFLSAGFYREIGMKDKYFDELEGIVRRSLPFPLAYSALAEKRAEDGSFDEAFALCAKGFTLRRKLGNPPYTTLDKLHIITRYGCLHTISRAERLIKEPEPNEYLGLAFLHFYVGNPNAALNILNDFSDKYSSFLPHAGVLKVDILNGIGRKAEATDELKALFSTLRGPEYKREDIGETTRDVYVFGPSKFIKGSLLFKEGFPEELAFEADTVHSLEALVSGHRNFRLPEQLGNIFSYDVEGRQRSVYTEWFIPSQRLLQKFDDGDFSSLEGVVDYLALLHSHKPLADRSRKGRLSLDLSLEEKLANQDLDCSGLLAKKIVHNAAPVLASLSDAVYVFNKDAHPENWLIADDGSIFAVDFQDKGLVPIPFDLVNLMEYGRYKDLTVERKFAVLDSYMYLYNSRVEPDLRVTSKEGFKLGYLNAVVHRAVSLSSAWSSPDRRGMWIKRSAVIGNAVQAIDGVEACFGDYYRKYKENYVNLREAMTDLASAVSIKLTG